jgi:hypothetical protein
MFHETLPQFPSESRGDTAIALAIKTSERQHSWPDLRPRASLPLETDPHRELPASTAPPSLEHAEGHLKPKRESTVKYRESRYDEHPTSISVNQSQE